MPILINKLPGALSIEGAGGHTYHIDGSQSIEITDEDVFAMREMGAFKLLEEQGSVILEGVTEPTPEPAPEPKPDPETEPEADIPPRRRGRPPKQRDDAD